MKMGKFYLEFIIIIEPLSKVWQMLDKIANEHRIIVKIL